MRGLLRRFKQSLRDGECVIGPFMKTCDPAFVEVAGYAGFDFAILDMEHGPISVKEMENNIRAAIISRTCSHSKGTGFQRDQYWKSSGYWCHGGTSTPDTECPGRRGKLSKGLSSLPKANEAYAASLGQQTTLL